MSQVRAVLNTAWDRFCAHLPVVFAMTVIGSASPRDPEAPEAVLTEDVPHLASSDSAAGAHLAHVSSRLCCRGLFVGTTVESFAQAVCILHALMPSRVG
jgi:hypothetical protein